jgi:hypothetical protein
MMSFSTWQAIAQRHLRYRKYLEERLKEWPEDRVNACKDMTVLESIIELTDRVERHQARMDRHAERALAYIEVPDARRH